MQPYRSFTDKPGLQQALAGAGVLAWWQGAEFFVSDLAAAQAVVSAYDPLPAVQQEALATVAATLASRISGGFTYSGVLIACDDQSQGRLNRVAAMASNLISGQITKAWVSRTWPSMTRGSPGLPVATPQAMIAFAAAIGGFVGDNEFHAADLEAQIMASTATATSIAALDLDNAQGTWPAS